MDPSSDSVQRSNERGTEELVGLQGANQPPASRSTRLGINWTEILAKKNLESPGYEETKQSIIQKYKKQ
jgi:hypothetical protein